MKWAGPAIYQTALGAVGLIDQLLAADHAVQQIFLGGFRIEIHDQAPHVLPYLGPIGQ
jgi:hypothetical protein